MSPRTADLAHWQEPTNALALHGSSIPIASDWIMLEILGAAGNLLVAKTALEWKAAAGAKHCFIRHLNEMGGVLVEQPSGHAVTASRVSGEPVVERQVFGAHHTWTISDEIPVLDGDRPVQVLVGLNDPHGPSWSDRSLRMVLSSDAPFHWRVTDQGHLDCANRLEDFTGEVIRAPGAVVAQDLERPLDVERSGYLWFGFHASVSGQMFAESAAGERILAGEGRSAVLEPGPWMLRVPEARGTDVSLFAILADVPPEFTHRLA